MSFYIPQSNVTEVGRFVHGYVHPSQEWLRNILKVNFKGVNKHQNISF
jgi:hypothetical protein